MSAPSSTDFFGTTTPAAKFADVGDAVEGTVSKVEIRQQTDFDTQALLYWPDGRPKWMAVVTLTDTEGNEIALYARGLMQASIRSALRSKGLTDLPVGSHLKVTYSGDGEPSRKGLNAPKQYTAEVETVPF